MERRRGGKAALENSPPLKKINANKTASYLTFLRWASEPHRPGGNTGEWQR